MTIEDKLIEGPHGLNFSIQVKPENSINLKPEVIDRNEWAHYDFVNDVFNDKHPNSSTNGSDFLHIEMLQRIVPDAKLSELEAEFGVLLKLISVVDAYKDSSKGTYASIPSIKERLILPKVDSNDDVADRYADLLHILDKKPAEIKYLNEHPEFSKSKVSDIAQMLLKKHPQVYELEKEARQPILLSEALENGGTNKPAYALHFTPSGLATYDPAGRSDWGSLQIVTDKENAERLLKLAETSPADLRKGMIDLTAKHFSRAVNNVPTENYDKPNMKYLLIAEGDIFDRKEKFVAYDKIGDKNDKIT